MENNRNFFITIAASVLILTLWQVFYMNPRVEQQRETARIEAQRQAESKPANGTALPGAQTQQPGAVPNCRVPTRRRRRGATRRSQPTSA